MKGKYVIMFTGYGQQKGTLVTKLQNNHWQPLNIVLLENIPWYLSLYLHTAKVICKGKPIRPGKKTFLRFLCNKCKQTLY